MGNDDRQNIGAERMNEIIKLLMVHSMTIQEISDEMMLSRRMVCKYLAKLENMCKIRHSRPEIGARGGKLKVYSLVFGAMSLDSKQSEYHPMRPRKFVKEKTGPKPMRDKEKWNEGLQTVRTVPAQQVGVQRDELVAALFGRAA